MKAIVIGKKFKTNVADRRR